MRSVVVVMAAFNAENTLSPVVRGLRKSLPGAFVIGINDGSTDGAGALLRSVCDRAIEFAVNKGKGAALRTAFEHCETRADGIDVVVTADSDGQHAAHDLVRVAMRTLDELRQGGRTVGLISHVAAMKQQLPAQLIVESTPQGPSVIRQDVEVRLAR